MFPDHSDARLFDASPVSAYFRATLKRIRPSAREDVCRIMRFMVTKGASRKLLNSLYSRLTPSQTEYWHTEYAKLFRGVRPIALRGNWRATFAGKRVTLPLDASDMWLHWDSALSLLGHEVEIKRTYRALIRSPYRPKLFFDVGANYGLHSLLFLVHGVPTVSFEPNPHCHSYFRRVTQLNEVKFDLRPVALGDDDGFVNLWFPRTGTWYGTTIPDVRDQISSDEAIETLQVQQTTLDRFVAETALRPGLIKIDTEGGEAAVLRGATNTLKELRPLVVFESWQDSGRSELFELFQSSGFTIATLPGEKNATRILNEVALFVDAPNRNFIAAPNELVSGHSSVFNYL